MKMSKVWEMFGTVGTVIVVMLLGAAQAQGAQIKMDAAMGTASILANSKQTGYLRVALTGFECTDPSRRAPINLAIVLDKSGSMGGTKLAKAKEAAAMVVERLRPDDIISVVAYDSLVTVLVPATRATDKASIQAAIQSITAGSTTALFAGVSKGAAEVRKFLEQERVNRIILLSDGLANAGPSSPGDLAELGASLIKEGISVTTIGLGLDYNEDLMAALAIKSDGNHLFAEKAEDLVVAFEREFGDILSVVATDITMKITCEPGVRPVRSLGREASISGQNVYTGLNQIYAGQTRYILLEVELESGADGTRIPVAQVDVAYMNMVKEAAERLQSAVSVTATNSLVRVAADENREVMEAVVYQISVERNEMAMRLRDEGKIEEGKQVLRENIDYLHSNRLRDTEWGISNVLMLEKMDSDWEKTRKIMKKEQHGVKQQMSN